MSLLEGIFGWCLPVKCHTDDHTEPILGVTASTELPAKKTSTDDRTVRDGIAPRIADLQAIRMINTSKDVGSGTSEDIMCTPARPEEQASNCMFERIPNDVLIEEETNKSYSSKTWYTVLIGETLVEKYRILTKLGYGDTSTVWLAYDIRNSRYVSVKVCANSTDQRVRELDIMLHIRRLGSNHPGATSIATLLDHFHVRREDRLYLCLVFDVLGPSLAEQVPDTNTKLDMDWVKEQLYQLLQALDFLHTEAHIVHADIWPPNVLSAIANNNALKELEELELRHPSARKIDGRRVIYVSRATALQSSRMPVLVDFGNSRIATEAWEHDMMRALQTADSIENDGPEKTTKDIIWLANTFIKMVNGKALYRILYPQISWQASANTRGRVPWRSNQAQDGPEILRRGGTCSNPVPEPIEVQAPEEERQQLLRLLYRMKNCSERRPEAKEFLTDPLFGDQGSISNLFLK